MHFSVELFNSKKRVFALFCGFFVILGISKEIFAFMTEKPLKMASVRVCQRTLHVCCTKLACYGGISKWFLMYYTAMTSGVEYDFSTPILMIFCSQPAHIL